MVDLKLPENKSSMEVRRFNNDLAQFFLEYWHTAMLISIKKIMNSSDYARKDAEEIASGILTDVYIELHIMSFRESSKSKHIGFGLLNQMVTFRTIDFIRKDIRRRKLIVSVANKNFEVEKDLDNYFKQVYDILRKYNKTEDEIECFVSKVTNSESNVSLAKRYRISRNRIPKEVKKMKSILANELEI